MARKLMDDEVIVSGDILYANNAFYDMAKGAVGATAIYWETLGGTRSRDASRWVEREDYYDDLLKKIGKIRRELWMNEY